MASKHDLRVLVDVGCFSYVTVSHRTNLLLPPLNGSGYSATGLRYTSELLPSACPVGAIFVIAIYRIGRKLTGRGAIKVPNRELVGRTWNEVDSFGLGTQVFSCPIYPNIHALYLVIGLWKGQVLGQESWT